MQNAETVLGVLRERGRRGLPLDELYRQLFNPQLYLLAYGRIYSNKGAMTPGATGETADGMSLGKIGRIIELSVAAACRLSTAGSCHPSTATQPGMSMSRGISKGFRIVAPFRSFPSPVAAMAGAAVLGLSRELRTQPARNRPRTSRRGQVEHKPVAMSPASARPPRLAHSPRATSCRNNQHRPHRSLHSAAPLKPLPPPIDLGQSPCPKTGSRRWSGQRISPGRMTWTRFSARTMAGLLSELRGEFGRAGSPGPTATYDSAPTSRRTRPRSTRFLTAAGM